MVQILQLVGLGGTFDHFHQGHKFLLKTALKVSEKIVVGITSKELLKNKKFSSELQDFNQRKENVVNFLESITKLKRFEVVKLDDPYGPPIHDSKYEGIVVSEETYENALNINQIREKKGFEPLIIVIIPYVKGEDNRRISSTKIREKLTE